MKQLSISTIQFKLFKFILDMLKHDLNFSKFLLKG